jgi:hypothetical protein
LSNPPVYSGGNWKKGIGKSGKVSYTAIGYGKEGEFKGTTRQRE